MRKNQNKKLKYNYWQFVFFLIILGLIFFFLANPHSISKLEFNETYFHEDNYQDLTSFSEQYEFVERWIDNLPDRALNMKYWEQINNSQSDLIISERNRAKDYFSKYNQGKDMEDFEKALFYTQLSYAYAETLPTLNCANSIEEISEKYTPWLFYYLSYSDKEKVLEIISKKASIESFLGWVERYPDDFNTTLRKSKDSLNIEESLELYKLKCEDFEKHLQEDYQRQKNWLVFKFIALIITLVFGIILNSQFNRWANKNKKNKITLWKRIGNILQPKKIQTKTIETIIKTNTVIAVFGAIAIGLINSNDWVFKIFGIYAFVDVLAILLSIVFGIYFLNNNSERAKRWCYYLFVGGILGFVGIVIFFFALFALTGFGNIIKQSVQTFLNNNTIH